MFINFDLKAYAPKSNKIFKNVNETTGRLDTSSEIQPETTAIKQIKYSSPSNFGLQQEIVNFEPDMLVFEIDGTSQGLSRKLKMKNSSNNYLTYKVSLLNFDR